MKIKKLHLDLTDHCNLSCVYCYIRKDRGDQCVEMKKESWFEIIKQGVQMGISSFVISGGEPLIFPGFLEILKKLEHHGSVTTVMTNLSGVAEHLIDAVVESSTVKEIVTSLDGFEGHNIARLHSNWREIVRNIKRLKERKIAGCKVTVNTVLHNRNLGEIEKLQDLLSDIGVDVWRLDIPIKPEDLTVMPDLEKVVEIGAILIKKRYANPCLQKVEIVMFRAYKSQLEGISFDDANTQSNLTLHPCNYFFGRFAVKSDGSITLCSPLQLPLSKIDFTSGGLARSVALAEKSKFFDLRVNDIKGCRNCRYIALCGSGCRADTIRWTGNATIADPVSCVIMPLVEQVIMPVLSQNLKTIYTRLIKEDGEAPMYARLCPLERR